MAFDSSRQVAVLFGGRDASPGVFQADTWEWNGKKWNQIKPINSPPGRIRHAMAYDSVRRRTVLFAGLASRSVLGDTWEWDGVNWRQAKPTVSPLARTSSAMAFDSVRGRTVLFGGMGGLASTWEWDGQNWKKLKTATSPPDRFGHAMVYDSARRRVVLFGGERGMFPNNKQLADTWEFDGVNWTQVKPTASPSGRHFHDMAYDSARRRTVLFGGSKNGAALADTWEWNGANWTRVKPTNSPSVRFEHAMAYDSARQRTVAIGGGHVFRLLGDTWEYGVAKLTLTANTSTISIANGGTQTLTLNAGGDVKNKSYWIFGSATSTMPGVVLTGLHIPLRPDIYTDIAIGAVNSNTFSKFRGTLSATGSATASFNVPARLPIPTGFKLYHAYIVYDGTTGQVFTSSNPVSVEFK